jgi:hypothetical protein
MAHKNWVYRKKGIAFERRRFPVSVPSSTASAVTLGVCDAGAGDGRARKRVRTGTSRCRRERESTKVHTGQTGTGKN